MESRKVALVQASMECFNNQDISGVLDLCIPDVEFPDVVNESVLRGRDAVAASFRQQFEVLDHVVTPAEIVEVGESVVVVALHHVFNAGETSLGPPFTAVHRYFFRDDLIARMEWNGLDDYPEPVRALLD